jgi:hypothetical protein
MGSVRNVVLTITDGMIGDDKKVHLEVLVYRFDIHSEEVGNLIRACRRVCYTPVKRLAYEPLAG